MPEWDLNVPNGWQQHVDQLLNECIMTLVVQQVEVLAAALTSNVYNIVQTQDTSQVKNLDMNMNEVVDNCIHMNAVLG
jgi:hypothetical protein